MAGLSPFMNVGRKIDTATGNSAQLALGSSVYPTMKGIVSSLTAIAMQPPAGPVAAGHDVAQPSAHQHARRAAHEQQQTICVPDLYRCPTMGGG